MKRQAVALALAACAACTSGEQLTTGGAPSAPTQPVVVGSVKVTRVRVFIKDGRPQAFVQGELGDGCNSLEGIRRQRQGNTVDIAVTYKRAGEVCTMIFQYLNEWVPLEGVADPGEYVVRANGTEVRFRLAREGATLRIDPDPGPLPQPPYIG
jgi:hypothetical protein